MTIMESIRNCKLFASLSEAEIDDLVRIGNIKSYSAGDFLLKEGEESNLIQLITQGTVEILKKEESTAPQKMGELAEGETIGEMALLQNEKAAATVRALDSVCVFQIDFSKIKSDPFAEIRFKIQGALAQLLAHRLTKTNAVTTIAMQGQLDALKSRVALGYMLITVIFLSASYDFALGMFLRLKEYFPTTTPLSIGMIFFYALFLFIAVHRSGYPMSSYGFTTHKWQSIVREAVVYTLPILAAILILKVILIYTIDSYYGYSIFDPTSVLHGEAKNSLGTYVFTVAAYVLFCPVQEFIARGALQGSLQMFLGRDSWWPIALAIILSNLLFASSHMHTTYLFALLAFIPGVFWGYLYNKQRSLIGVSVSHIMIGVWVSFIVGLPGLDG